MNPARPVETISDVPVSSLNSFREDSNFRQRAKVNIHGKPCSCSRFDYEHSVECLGLWLVHNWRGCDGDLGLRARFVRCQPQQLRRVGEYPRSTWGQPRAVRSAAAMASTSAICIG
jgi:hypothetical protein